MKALILNSGMGSRMGTLTADKPKCLVEISENGETILSRQLKLLCRNGITEVVITTGLYDRMIQEYCYQLGLDISYIFVKNEKYDKTNYIYSIYLAREYLNDDIIMMHGDLVFSPEVILDIINAPDSSVAISSTKPLPEKDFKGVIYKDDTGCEYISKVGIEFFESARTLQPLYKLKYESWKKWLKKIIEYCENENVNCYAENALNDLNGQCDIRAFDIEDELCEEIDNSSDYDRVKKMLK